MGFFSDLIGKLNGSVLFYRFKIMDVVEILIIAVLVYYLILWIKNTRAWVLMRGILVLFAFYVVAYVLQLDVILWIFVNAITVGITAIMIIFQPELRKALEQIGKRSEFLQVFSGKEQHGFSERTVDELVRAALELSKTRTGALIVIERSVKLDDYEQTGIAVDAIITSELLINIFEKNTPLHDGAVIVRGDRVAAATCYLPLSDNMRLSKELGTRHRAGIGISEATDSVTLIVSEETGGISIAEGGSLMRRLGKDTLRSKLSTLQENTTEESPKFVLFKRSKTDRKTENG